MRVLLIAVLLVGCGAPAPGSAVVPLEHDAEVTLDGGGVCEAIPAEMATCSGCHVEAETLDGWAGAMPGSRFDGDTWGRHAFFVLFVQSNAATVPEHRASSAWAERCFCQDGTARNDERRCYTVAGDF